MFIDRDGTINRDCPYCKSADEISIYDDVYDPIKELSKRYYIIIVTNQSGIARGYFTEKDLALMHEKIKREIGTRGGRIDAIYYCPHMPDTGCRCRKPKTGMLEDAKRDFEIDINKSFVIGDAEIDIEMAKYAGVRSIKVRGTKTEIKPDFTADTFSEVLSIIRSQEKATTEL